MPRVYTNRIAGKRNYASGYTQTDLEQAIASVATGTSLRDAAKQFHIPLGTLHNKVKRKHEGAFGGQTILTTDEEERLVTVLKTLSVWRFPVDHYELRVLVKSMLDKSGRVVAKFKNNLPGKDWVSLFLRRHRAELRNRLTQNIKVARADISAEVIKDYFSNLSESVRDVPAANLWNYDETNFSDDPGRKKAIHRRGVRYPERVMNSSKTSVSVMFCGNAEGTVLPPYTVYKAEHLWERWCIGGPKGARFNRTRSGWFDGFTFSDWFLTTFLPAAKKQNGPKVLIGDNLSSHLSEEIVTQCEANNIRFVFLPPNSTHLTQPLDVAFFRPLKIAWRKVLSDWKAKQLRGGGTIPKEEFPGLLKKVEERVGFNSSINLKQGFRTCGIFPHDPNVVLARLPGARSGEINNQVLNEAVLEMLTNQSPEGNAEPKKKQRRTRVKVAAGKSVCADDFVATTDRAGEANTSSTPDVETGSSAKGTKAKAQKLKRTGAGKRSISPEDSGSSSGSSSDSDSMNNSDNESETEPYSDVEPGLSGVKDTGCFSVNFKEIDIQTGDWVAVDFSATEKSKVFLGQVEAVQKSGFEGLFMRNSGSDPQVFSFPVNEDRSSFTITMIKAKLDPPVPVRRGAWRFVGFNPKQWSSP